MAQQLVRQGQEDDDEEEVTLTVTSKSVDVDFNGVGLNNNNGDEGGSRGEGGGKAARLPRWTRQEILVLIQGKRVAENRVRRGRTAVLCEGEGGQGQQVEPKWATVSSYCKRHGVNRGPVQCRKRWSNLAGDFKKIKEWESQIKDESDSFWSMRNDVRRERKLPGFFDKEVFDILTSNSSSSSGFPIPSESDTNTNTNTPRLKLVDGEGDVEAVFDSGRSATADDGLFSDFEQSAQPLQHHHQQHQQQEAVDDEMGKSSAENEADADTELHAPPPLMSSIPAPTPISEKQYQPVTAEGTAGANQEKQRVGLNPEIGSTSREGGGRKRKRALEEEEGGAQLQAQDELVQVLERNGRVLSAHLDAYNLNLKLDREERKDHASSLVAVLNKLADTLGRIADKL